MENRGQKRADTVDELPADKRACSSFDFRTNTSTTYLMSSYSIPETQNSSIETQMSPGRHSTPETHNSSDETQVNSTQAILDGPQNSSIQIQVNVVPDEAINSFVQTQVNSHNSTSDNSHNGDVDTYSSASGSSRSDGENERDSAYGSCDSDDDDENLREYQERESSSAPGRFKSIISSLSEESDPSGQLAGLTQLCEVLSFCTESSVSNTTADSLSPLLVTFARHESNPDVMLLAIRAITYLCDVFPQSSIFLVQHDAVPALCQRLMAIEYMDVAEQCLQAMEKISRDQPLACLQAGAIMAVLNYIDFFSTSLQRVALSTVVNICKKLPSECPSVIEAVPILCNLLQYEDRQLVENVASCLIKIVERVSPSSDMLDEICKHGLVNQATHLINLNSRTTISQPIYNSLIGLLVKLASGSVIAFSTLYELNISSILKDILSTHELSHGMSSPYVADGRCSQVYEVLKLLNELLPGSARDLNVQPMMDKGSFLFNHLDLLQGFGMDILPTLIQVINSGANLYVCYGCLSVINKLVNLTQPDMLLELLKDANVSSFLAGVFTRKDHHVLMLALEIAEVILQKLSNYYLTSFIKEGVLFAIDALLTPEKCSRLMFPMFGELSVDSSPQSAGKEVRRCLCYAFDICQSSKASQGSCKIEKDSVHNLANQIRTSYFRAELCESEKGMTDILQKLKGYSVALDNLMNTYTDDSADQHDGKCSCILHQIVAKLSGREQISTFEFIESGLVKSLVSYLSCGQYARRDKAEFHSVCGIPYTIEKRFEVLGRVFFSSSDTRFEDFPLLVLIQKLQSALCSLENFPVILSPVPKRKHSLATVPNRRSIVHPCLRVAFVRGEGETCLDEHSGDVLTVDPLSSFDAIEDFLWPGVCSKRTELARPYTTETKGHTLSSQDEIPDPMDSDMSVALTELEIDGANLSQTGPRRQVHSAETSSMDGNHVDSAMEEQYLPVEADTDRKVENHASCSGDYASSKLLFYLGEQQLDRTLTFYQAILQQLIKAENAIFSDPKFWSQTYTVTYRSFIEPELPEPQEGLLSTQNLSVLDKVRSYVFSSMFTCQLASDLDMSDPTYDILLLLKSLERMNRLSFHLMARERIVAFAEGRTDILDALKITVASVPQKEFVSSKLTEKLEQQMKDSLAVSTGGMPPWCIQLMTSCPFLFSFEARSKYFRLEAFGTQQVQIRSSNNNNGSPSDRRSSTGALPRKKFLVCRDRVLESAAQMMDLYARKKVVIEVEYTEEVGTGLGPTLEFYTLVSLEFQKCGLCMWRGDQNFLATSQLPQGNDSGFLTSPCGLFPRPWSSALEISNGVQFSEVTKKFVLLGQVVAKALQDGRVMDFPFSKAFYKLILGQELSLYDIQSFDPELGQTLLEFHAIVARNMHLYSVGAEHSSNGVDSCFRGTKIEDLCLDFTLPGYPDYHLTSGSDHSMVTMTNLEDYVSLIVNATIKDGISRQLDAFKSGFNQVFPIEHLHMFTEEEIERLLCGESETWAFNELIDHIKFDHGYTASSPPITSLLEIILELNNEERRAFIQFVTGAPRLPPGGLASLHPKLTIVRKHCSKRADEDLPSVMTCANYLKLPPYSSKERMKEKLLYAITEGQGSFHLS